MQQEYATPYATWPIAATLPYARIFACEEFSAKGKARRVTVTVIEQEEPERVAGPSRPEEPTLRSPGTRMVAILDGNPMVARVLDLLLQGCGYETRLLEEAEPDRLEDLPLDGVDLLLLTPDFSTERTKFFLSGIRSIPEMADLPVLIMLSSVSDVLPTPGAKTVPWPCRTEELVREIEAALAATGPRR